MRWYPRRKQNHAIQCERPPRGNRHVDVPGVHGVEGSAQDAQARVKGHSVSVLGSSSVRCRRRAFARGRHFAPHGFQQGIDPFASDRRNRVERNTKRLQMRLQSFEP